MTLMPPRLLPKRSGVYVGLAFLRFAHEALVTFGLRDFNFSDTFTMGEAASQSWIHFVSIR